MKEKCYSCSGTKECEECGGEGCFCEETHDGERCTKAKLNGPCENLPCDTCDGSGACAACKERATT